MGLQPGGLLAGNEFGDDWEGCVVAAGNSS